MKAEAVTLALLGLAALAGCGAGERPPAIARDGECAACGMSTSSPRFACERKVAGRWRVYDSIECLLGDAAETPGGRVILADYDSGTLHAAESVWVVRGSFSSPMGGGLAAFYQRAAADSVAAEVHGRVMRFAEIAPGKGGS